MNAAFTKPKIVVRRNQFAPDEYLQKDGTWGAYKTARRFASQAAAECVAWAHGIEVFGLFPVSTPRRRA